MSWQTITVDLSAHTNHEVTLRLYQRVLLPGQQLKVPGNAYWKGIVIR